jgi:hypothetical protein
MSSQDVGTLEGIHAFGVLLLTASGLYLLVQLLGELVDAWGWDGLALVAFGIGVSLILIARALDRGVV